MLHIEYHHDDYTIENLQVKITPTPYEDIFTQANIADKENYEIITENEQQPTFTPNEKLILQLKTEEAVKRDITVLTQIGTSLHKHLMFHLKTKFCNKHYTNLFVENDGVNKLFETIIQSEGNTQSYALNSLMSLMSDENGFHAIVEWEQCGDVLYSFLTKSTPVNISRQAAELCTVLCKFVGTEMIDDAASKWATRNGKRKYENIIELTLSGDIQTAENSMLLVDSLMIGQTKQTLLELLKEYNVMDKLKYSGSEIIQRILIMINDELNSENGTKKTFDDLKLFMNELNDTENKRYTLEKQEKEVNTHLKQLREHEKNLKNEEIQLKNQMKDISQETEKWKKRKEMVDRKAEAIMTFPTREQMIQEIKYYKQLLDYGEHKKNEMKTKISEMKEEETDYQYEIDTDVTNVFDDQLMSNAPLAPTLTKESIDIINNGKHIVSGYSRNAFILLHNRIKLDVLIKTINGENKTIDDQSMKLLMNIIEKADLSQIQNITNIQEYSEVDQFALQILTIPFVKEKTRIVCKIIKIHERLDKLVTPLRIIESACNSVKKSNNLKDVLTQVLSIGNFVNAGCPQLERADGFGIEILTMLKYIGNSQTYAEYITSVVDINGLETDLKICKDIEEDIPSIKFKLQNISLILDEIDQLYQQMISSGNTFPTIEKEISIINTKAQNYIKKCDQTESLFKNTLYYFTADENAYQNYSVITFFAIFAEMLTGLKLAAVSEQERQKHVIEEHKHLFQQNDDHMSSLVAQLKSNQTSGKPFKK